MGIRTLCTKNVPHIINSLFGSKRPIAIVDDNSDDRFFMKREVNFLFGETPVLTFDSAADLSFYLQNNDDELKKPVLVILDLHMPGIDGFKMIERLKTFRRLVDIPVIAVSETLEEAEAEAVVKLGAVAFLPKPMTRGTFIDAFLHKDHHQKYNGKRTP